MWNLFSNGFLLTPAVFVSCETISRKNEINMMLSFFANLTGNINANYLKRCLLCSQIILLTDTD